MRDDLNKLQDISQLYDWEGYERILLGVASVLAWFPVVWAFLLPDIMDIHGWVNSFFSLQEGSSVKETVFIGYILIIGAIYMIFFGILAYSLPKYYILPTWILSLAAFYHEMKQIIISIIYPFEPDHFYYSESTYESYHGFSLQNVFFAVLALFFLIILFRPARHYARVIWHRIRHFRKA